MILVTSVRKSLRGRYYFSRAILRVSMHEGRLGAGVAAVVVQAAKLVVDTLTIGTGMARLLKHRALPFPKAEAERWHRVWATLTQPPLEESNASTPLTRW